MFLCDEYSGTNGLLTSFIGVKHNQLKSQVNNSRNTKEISGDIIALLYRCRDIFDLSYCLLFKLSVLPNALSG